MSRLIILVLLFAGTFFSCSESNVAKEEKAVLTPFQKEVQAFLDEYNTGFKKCLLAANEGQWKMQTYMVPGDTVSEKQAQVYDQAFANYTGSAAFIEKSKTFLKKESDLAGLQARQLKYILFLAGGNPETSKEDVTKRIEIQNRQVGLLYTFPYSYNGKRVTVNTLDSLLHNETNVSKRLAVWNASKEVGKTLRDGLSNLQQLRNSCVRGLGYSDFFSYQVSEYDMTSDELLAECKKMIADVWPLYRELHTWARYTLAEKYKQPVPEYLPAHWLPNRWGQDWTSMVEVKGFNVDSALGTKTKEWIIEQAEGFYVSMGYNKLPKIFWEKSSLFPVSATAGYSKNNHASAWHMDNDQDVRSLMSVETNSEWWGTTLHELGHIFYFLEYSKPDVPVVLRAGTNRAYHEAFGTMIALVSMHKDFLKGRGLVNADADVDEIQTLLKEALDYIVMVPWAAGTMTEYEYDLYKNELPKETYNKRWWELVKKYQGIVPPAERNETYCDAATKTHIIDDAAQYYDYALSNVLLFQFHEHIATKVLKQDVHNTNYWDSKGAGDFLKSIMRPGATVDWKDHLQKVLGEGMNAGAMVRYFEPLMNYLKGQNKGRVPTLPEKFEN
ncbi:MAG: M2 family metallopeptidase [Flavobacteriales bacterium]